MITRPAEIGYTAVHIATPVTQLLCWEADQPREHIIQTAQQHNLTYIPVRSEGRVSSIITRQALIEQQQPQPLTTDWLIASDTPILELINLFVQQPDRVFLMLQASRIAGLIAPADLNKIPARATVYLLIAHFEAELARLIRNTITDDEALRAALSDDRWGMLLEEKKKTAAGDIEVDMLHYMHIYDLVLIARRNDTLRQKLGYTTTSQARKALDFQSLRNRVSHPTRPLITTREELLDLNKACQRLVEINRRIERACADSIEQQGGK